MENQVLHMIGNAHLDPVWLWRWEEGFQSAKATFRSALDRMKETEEFVFTSSSAAYYEWIEWNDPEMFEEIRARVREGRWHLAGGWWVQPDCNIPSGESLARQELYGQRYFKEKFGVTARVGYNVDSFGHNGMIPQILKKGGMDYYVFMRPMPGEKALPSRVFRWESDDGAQVLAFRILFEYLTWGKEVDTHVRRCLSELKAPMSQTMVFYGVGNHGGGPTKENLVSIRRLNEDESLPELRFSDPLRFFESVEQQGLDFPVVHDDLQHHASGCYAGNSLIKRQNRRAENALLSAEKFSAVAREFQPWPDLSRAWKSLLFNQFHDILAGCSLESAYEDARDQIGESVAVARRAQNYALQALSWRIGLRQEDGMLPIVVFQPNAWETRAHVEVELASWKGGADLRDDQGTSIPFQCVHPEASCNGRTRICFAADLPALGYRTFRLYQPNQPDGVREEYQVPAKQETFMENTWYRIEFDPETGAISSLYDREQGVQVFSGPAAVPVVMRDDSDTWSHDVLRFEDRIGSFQAVRVRRVENGPVRTVIRVTSVYENSRLIQDFIQYPDSRRIDVRVTLDWRGQHQMVKLLFPVSVFFNRNSYEIPYGFIEREGNGEEEPMQNWVDVSGLVPGEGKGSQAGVAILNDGKYSASVSGNVIGLTVLRSPIYAHHKPYIPSEDLEYPFIDQGIQRFSYAILPHHGNWEDANVPREGWDFNQRPVTVLETFHEGPLPQADSFVSCDRNNVLVAVLKQAEEGGDLILRAYEAHKIATQATITVFGRKIHAAFGPCEIKTLRIPCKTDAPVREINLLEE